MILKTLSQLTELTTENKWMENNFLTHLNQWNEPIFFVLAQNYNFVTKLFIWIMLFFLLKYFIMYKKCICINKHKFS